MHMYSYPILAALVVLLFPKTFTVFKFPIFWLRMYLMKDLPETRRVR
jgi:hypothetical protein